MESVWTALQSPQDENSLPLYIENESDMNSSILQLKQAASANDQPLPVESYESKPEIFKDTSPIAILRQRIVSTFFDAISAPNPDLITLFIQHNLVTTATTSDGLTPLLAAISHHPASTRLVKHMLSLGASVNEFGVVETIPTTTLRYPSVQIKRTPLQLAAEKGSRSVVKLLMENGADDSLIAPDGETALRLAARNGHREVVAYLPVRRGGGFRRWKTKHQIAMRRARRAAKGIYKFFKFFIWDLPKFLVWTLPKHAVVKPVIKSAKWVWKHGGEIPGKIMRGCKKVWETAKKIPKELWEFMVWLVKGIWKAILKTPQALKILGQWVWHGVATVFKVVAYVIHRTASFLHTLFQAVFTFFRDLSMQDVLNGFISAIQAIFVELPLTLGKWLAKFGKASYEAMKATFGFLGSCLWWCIRSLFEFVVLYVPRKILQIAASFGESTKKAGEELLIWWDPKRQL